MPEKDELVVEGKKLSVSNLDKVLYPKVGFTKGQVIDYYIRIAPVLLPHLKDRPLDDEALSERRGQGIFLRKELSVASAEMGEDGEGLERRQQSNDGLLPRPGSADAWFGRRTWPISNCTLRSRKRTTSRGRR